MMFGDKRARVCEQLAQSYYSEVKQPGVRIFVVDSESHYVYVRFTDSVL